jgi:hypothetical protein
MAFEMFSVDDHCITIMDSRAIAWTSANKQLRFTLYMNSPEEGQFEQSLAEKSSLEITMQSQSVTVLVRSSSAPSNDAMEERTTTSSIASGHPGNGFRSLSVKQEDSLEPQVCIVP